MKIKLQNMDIDLQQLIKGDVFTSDDISKLMASKLNNNGNILEPSVASGNLLKYINLKNYEYADIFEIKKTGKIKGVIIGKAIYDGSIKLQELAEIN